MPTERYCSATEDHEHVIDFQSITQADVEPENMPDGGTWMIMDVSCTACGQSGAFRVPAVSEIDW